MNDIDFKTYIEESPKLIRNLKLNKSPILLDINKKSFSEMYDHISNKEIYKRHEFIKNNVYFKERVKKHFLDKSEHKSEIQDDIYAEETIYKKFISNVDNAIIQKFNRSTWEDKILLIKEFKDERLRYFAELIFFQEKPELLNKDRYNLIKNHQSSRLLSENSEKWLTIFEAYKKIDDLRDKYDNNNNKEALNILENINSYMEKIEKKLQ